MRIEDTSLRSPEDSLRKIERVVSPRFGIARTITRIQLGPDEPRLHLFSVEPAYRSLGGLGAARNTGGAGLSVTDAKLSALGELLEGYCAAAMPPKMEIFGTYKELSRHHEVVEPARFALFSENQYASNGFPFRPFNEDTPVAWVWGYSLIREKRVLVPASRVYLPYSKRPEEADIGPLLSTGLAGAGSLETAILSGLYECIERDAFTIFWLNNLPVRRIDIRGSSSAVPFKRLHDELFDVSGYEYHVYDITNDLNVSTIYVILAVNSPRGKIYPIGASSRLDGVEAVFKAVTEAIQGKPYVLHEMKQEPNWRPRPDFADVDSFARSCKVYSIEPALVPHLLSVEERAHATVTLENLPRWETPGAVAAIQHITNQLRARDYEAIIVDLTTSDVDALGVKVVRVITPELQHLHGHHAWPFLGGRRIFEVPARLGFREGMPTEKAFCQYPHPFP